MKHTTLYRLGMAIVGLSVGFSAGASTPVNGHGGMRGFTANGAAKQQQLEQQFDSLLNGSEMRGWLKRLSSAPNQVGSPHDKANAEFILSRFRQWGWDAHIETFSVLYPTPKKVQVELVAPTHFTATLHEPPIKGDRTSALTGALPPYNVYGADGDVAAPLVYVNYGMPEDYKTLARRGISVKGKIVIVRYGGGWRGLKPELAYEHGAVGCLIYSDPRNDGYYHSDPYPKGGSRPAESVQRGSVVKMQLYPGDPTTPGYGSVPGARHVPVDEAKSLLHIPVLPISYADATPLLKALGGPVAPPAWRGALPFTYHIGAGPAKVHMVVQSDWSRKKIYDVIAKLKGIGDANQWVVRGNHHDGWVFGAFDPLAGTVAMLGEAKALGTLYQQGWRPTRTIVYASWDAEEPGLLGSTEWAETHAEKLQDKAVLYLNSDTNGRGVLYAGGSHSFQHLINQVAADVTDPETQVSVQQRMRAFHRIRSRGRDHSSQAGNPGGDVQISPLGSGSDYSAFLQHLGIATLNIGFGGEADQGGVYHSRYDSFDHFIRFGDPTFEYEVALAKVAGRIVMRTANAKVLPMRITDFSATLKRYIAQLHNQVEQARKTTRRQHRLLDDGIYKLVADPQHPVSPPVRLSNVPYIDFASLDNAAARLKRSVQAFAKAYKKHAANGLEFGGHTLDQINALLGSLEQQLLSQDGLPGRPWYKNMIQAPGALTGYAPKVIPGVHEALDARDWKRANKYAAITAKVIDNYRAQLDKLTALLQE